MKMLKKLHGFYKKNPLKLKNISKGKQKKLLEKEKKRDLGRLIDAITLNDEETIVENDINKILQRK